MGDNPQSYKNRSGPTAPLDAGMMSPKDARLYIRMTGTAGTPFFQPATGTLDEWNEAFSRVEDYFRAHRVHSRLHQSELVYKIVTRAAERHEADPATPPVTHAVREADAAINSWLRTQIGDEGMDAEKAGRLGRVAFLLAEGPAKHPEMFLDNDLPDDVRAGMRRRLEQSGPNLEVSSMVGRDLDLGLFPDVAEFAWDLLNKTPLFRMLLLWALFALILTGIFLLIRQ